MLTEIVRKSLDRVNNRFELVVLTSERTRQLLLGARATVDNPAREKMSKVAMREVIESRFKRHPDGWLLDRPPMPDIFTPPPSPSEDEEDILGLRARRGGEDDEE